MRNAFIFKSLSVVTTVSQRALQTLLWPQITPTFTFNLVFPARSHDLPQPHCSWVTSPQPPHSVPKNTCSDLVCDSSFNVQHCSSLHPCARSLNMSCLWTRAIYCCSSFPHLQIKFYIVGDRFAYFDQLHHSCGFVSSLLSRTCRTQTQVQILPYTEVRLFPWDLPVHLFTKALREANGKQTQMNHIQQLKTNCLRQQLGSTQPFNFTCKKEKSHIFQTQLYCTSFIFLNYLLS